MDPTLAQQEVSNTMVNRFTNRFRANLKSAYASGAISEKDNFADVVIAVLNITARSFYPIDGKAKSIERNLSHFI